MPRHISARDRKGNVIARRAAIPRPLADRLMDAGFGIAREILAVQGVGPGILAKLRAWVNP
jgi:hypothetical protein